MKSVIPHPKHIAKVAPDMHQQSPQQTSLMQESGKTELSHVDGWEIV